MSGYVCRLCSTRVSKMTHHRCEFANGDYALPPAFFRRDMKVYVIGSLRNPKVPIVADELRDALGCEVFDDWFAAGPEADDNWKAYEQGRGRTYAEALQGYAARHVYSFDKGHLESSTHVVLILPAGKSGHLELGYAVGQGKTGAVLLESAEDRWDVMYQFASSVVSDVDALIECLKESA